MRWPGWSTGWWEDATYSSRILSREPLLAGVVILTLALGIGANTSMFGVIDHVLLSGPPLLEDAQSLSRVYLTRQIAEGGERTSEAAGYVLYQLLRDEAQTLSAVGAYSLQNRLVGDGLNARRMAVAYATHDLFQLTGVPAQLGAVFGPDEDVPPQGSRVAVLSHHFWVSELGGDPDVLGRELRVEDEPFTIIGVMPRGFTGPQFAAVDLWLPMSTISPPTENWPTAWNAQWLSIVVRTNPDRTREQTEAEITDLYRRAYGGTLSAADLSLSLRPLQAGSGGENPPDLFIASWLLGVSVVLLLVACANVSSLILARSLRRRHEIAVRLALGVSRLRLARLILTESLLLASLGGLVAFGFASLAGDLVRRFLLPEFAWELAPVSQNVLIFGVAMALLVGLLVGAAPALHAVRGVPLIALRGGGRHGGRGVSRARSALTVAQVSMSVVLLVGAGLFSRSLWNAQRLDLGFEPSQVLALQVRWSGLGQLPPEERDGERERRRLFSEQAAVQLESLPQVDRAAAAVGTPFGNAFGVPLVVPGWDSIPSMPGGGPYVSAVSSSYFDGVGTSVVHGTGFTPTDRAGTEPVAIVNETMATILWPDTEPLGRCIQVGGPSSPCARVIGIVEDARRNGLVEEPAFQYYIPFGQEEGFGGTILIVKPADAPAGDLPSTIRQELARLDPGIPFVEVTSLQEVVDPVYRPWKLGASMFSVFGALALLIAGVGLYSLIASAVTRRRSEFGIRAALGASSGSVVRLVLTQEGWLVLAGTAIGVLGARIASRGIEPLLFGSSSLDAGIYAIVALLLVLTAAVGSVVPAASAARANPMETLREN